jgi:hypothetical protein
MGKRTIEVETPTALVGEVVLPAGEEVSLKRLRGSRPLGRVAYRVPAGEKVVLHLKET